MQNIRAFFVVASAIAVLAMAALFTAYLTVAFAGILVLLSIGRAISTRLNPVPVRAKSFGPKPASRDIRVWNDGRGTIIDL
ncbi:hypothetical protein ASF70_22905 [Rhizobium sp. Leaf321]|uniref:hypothetical protein n=1 Tax=Rhizobium sp. Leaf321 TaxID=1736335 RepID=UPI000712D5A6|nr:hypothetical protein [Rhizobium sp. Leaf321]KQQ78479.1 hypothetical protein ASF70_22905 [Rhizobium sp. Leaf321]